MTDSSLVPLVLGMAQQPGQGQPNVWIQLAPFALMILIFYVLVLLPMRRRQKKIADFQSALKVGDKVVMTSGIYGKVTKVQDATVQVEIAERVRVEVARAAIGGMQGQEPVVRNDGGM